LAATVTVRVSSIRSRVFSIWFGFGLDLGGLGGDARAAGFLKLVKTALGFVGFSAEADGTAAEAEDFCQWHVRSGGLAERFERVKAEADDVGGETEFVLGLGVVGSEHLGRGFAGGGDVAGGAGEEEGGEAGEHGFNDSGGKRVGSARRDVMRWPAGYRVVNHQSITSPCPSRG
jgi:hypothetical protein